MKYNILIVEDDADIIELLTLYLDSSDFHVFSAFQPVKKRCRLPPRRIFLWPW